MDEKILAELTELRSLLEKQQKEIARLHELIQENYGIADRWSYEAHEQADRAMERADKARYEADEARRKADDAYYKAEDAMRKAEDASRNSRSW